MCAFCYSVDVSTVAGAVSALTYRVSDHGACIQLYSILSSYGELPYEDNILYNCILEIYRF